MNFNQSVEYIHSLLAFGIKPGLERISMLLDLLGNPQDKLKIVHIAGTNGKGSTSSMISNMLIADGHKTGLFTSPYVIDFCERIQINGENVDKNIFAECVTEVREKIEELNKQDVIITEFEAITVSAFLCFLKAECEYVVLEVGLGGRFDATNVVKSPQAVVITSISLDHVAILGDTISKIAFEKCGIIKENVPVITSSNQNDDALKVIKETCENKNCNLIVTNPKETEIFDDSIFGTVFAYNDNVYKTKLTGNHQIENTVNAIHCARVLGISENAITQGIENTRMIARMEIIGEKPLVIRDGGHNEGCANALYNFLNKYNVKNINMLVGLMADKDVEGYVKKIAPLCKSVVTVTPSNPRALNGDKLKEIAEKHCENTKCIDNPKEGYKYILSNTKEDETVLICGSFYLMSDIFAD
ncbi:MAG: bifunctional folylpolyglutamate synthase/dihydrofolate synthase [Clostridia bacterium]|nr:bifunctional folylpolyglutamate synthase/dihydrofolate synthase [Clostridia bacterium]